jgi:hypothetical protein
MPPDLVLCVGSVLVMPTFLAPGHDVLEKEPVSSTATVHTAFIPLGREDGLRVRCGRFTKCRAHRQRGRIGAVSDPQLLPSSLPG